MAPGTNSQELVTRGPSAHANLLICIIRDETNPEWRKNSFHQNLPSSTLLSYFYQLVAEKAGYNVGTFLLAYMKPCLNGKGDQEIVITETSNITLGILVGDCPGKKAFFIIKQKDGVEIVSHKEPTENTSQSPDESLENLFKSDFALSSPSYTAISTASNSQVFIPKTGGFVGLINQAMTCYLNSLLQTLFMTPEFRNALYRWKYEGTPDEGLKNIPYQIQRLFLRLQTSTKQSVETTDLTKSFGWDSSEAWQQHDVQELCRAMFDALEQTLKNTEEANLINHLYQGKVKDYVKCLKTMLLPNVTDSSANLERNYDCDHESARTDTYLDIPLAVRAFESKEAFSTVEDSLQAYVTAETLEGNNQYFCEKCNSKQDAKKGLSIISFPYLLTLQLKRFTFDYNTLQRIKLHDRVTFPETLDLSTFLSPEDKVEEEKSRISRSSSSSTKSLEVGEERGATAAPPVEERLLNGCIQKEPKENEDSGDTSHQYELFSIMVHSGSAVGGHYYAYIKSFTNAQWYCFNDHFVTTISQEDIEKSYGGLDRHSRGYYSTTFSSSTNAYMLMYRKKDPTRNTVFMQKSEWPTHIKDLADSLRQDEEDEQTRKERDRNTCKIRVFCVHPRDGHMLNAKLEVHKDSTLLETTAKCWKNYFVGHSTHSSGVYFLKSESNGPRNIFVEEKKLFALQNLVSLNDCRIIKYDDYYGSYDRSFEGEEETPIEKVLGGVRYSYNFDLLLETRNPGENFPVYEAGGSTVKVYSVDLEKEEVTGPSIVHASLSQTVKEFSELVEEKLGYPAESQRMALAKESIEFRMLDNPQKTLKAEGFYKSKKVYIEHSGGPDFSRDFNDSLFLRVLDKYIHTIRLFVGLPYSEEGKSELKEVSVRVDKRITLEEFKKTIKGHVGVDPDYFRVYRVYSNNQEIESTKLTDQLTSYTDDMKVVIRLGRALKAGESRVKLYLLDANKEEHTRFILETVVSKGMTVRQLKEQIQPELEKSHGISQPIERLRVRKKGYKNPGRIYIDDFVFDKDIVISFGFELFLEILDADDPVTSRDLLTVFARRWRPSKHEIGSFEEVVLKDGTVAELKQRLAEMAGTDPANIEIAKGGSFFPCEISVLNVQSDLEWNPRVKKLDEYPLSITDDGSVVFFRDKTEPVEELTEERKKEIKDKEKKKLQRATPTATSAMRKEKALKIYTNSS